MSNDSRDSTIRPGDEFSNVSLADRRFNFANASIDAIGWPLGSAFFSVTTVLPVYLQHLHANNALIGLLNALLAFLVLMPGVFVVPALGRRPYAKYWVFWVGLFERLALLPLAVLTPLWGQTHPEWLIGSVFVCFVVHGIFMGLNQPAYWALIGKTIPPRWRGRLFGFSGGFAGLLGIGLDWVMQHVVFQGPNGGFPDGFARGFLIGFVVLVVTLVPLVLIREPSGVANAVTVSEDTTHLGQAVLALWHEDRRFRQLLFAQIAIVLTNLATPFFVLHAQANLRATGEDIARYTTVVVFATAFGSLAWGALADSQGNRRALLLSGVCGLLCGVMAIVAPNAAYFNVVFALNALAFAGFALAGSNLMMEFAGDSRRIPLYSAVYNGVIAIPRAFSPLLGGLIADKFGYLWLFVALLLLTIAAFVMVLRVPEPRLDAQLHR